MSATFTGGGGVNFSYVAAQAAGFNAGAQLTDSDNVSQVFAAGNSAGQISTAFSGPETFSGTTAALNFGSGGGLVDLWGNAIANARLKLVYVRNTGANNLVMGGGSNPILSLIDGSGNLHLPPGAFFLAATPDGNGWSVTTSTACNFTFTGTSGQPFRVAALGCVS